MLMCDIRYRLNVDEVGVRIADGFDVYNARIVLDCVFKDLRALGRIDKRRLNPVIREGMFKEVIRAAVNRRSRHDMLSAVNQRLQRIGHSRRAGSHGHSRHAAFQSRDAPGKDILGRIRQTAIDIARILQGKAATGGRKDAGLKDYKFKRSCLKRLKINDKKQNMKV